MTDHSVHPHHETTDVNVRMVALSFIALALIVILVLTSVWWMYRLIREQDQVRNVRESLIPPPSPIPPAPRLQLDPAADYQTYKREQDHILNSYGWISREGGTVRIPIQRAMDLLAQRGLPTGSTTGKGKQ
jgi:hypothetical protein